LDALAEHPPQPKGAGTGASGHQQWLKASPELDSIGEGVPLGLHKACASPRHGAFKASCNQQC